MLIEQVPLDQLLEIAAEGDAESVGDRVSAVSSARRELGLHRHRGYSAPRPPSPCGSSSSCHGSILAVQSMAYKRVMPFGVSSQPTGGRPWLPARLADPALTGKPRADLATLTERVTPILAARAERHRRAGERLPDAHGEQPCRSPRRLPR
jgi:hypothetical protein